MIGTIIGLIFLCVILGVIVWAGKSLIALVPMDEPFKTIIYILFVLLVVVIVIYILIILLGFAGIHVKIPSADLGELVAGVRLT